MPGRSDSLPPFGTGAGGRLFDSHHEGDPIASELGKTREMQGIAACASLRSLLRERTLASHTQLEQTVPMRAIAGGTPSDADIRTYLSLQWSLHTPMEAALARWAPMDWADIRLRKTEWLRRDLRALGALPPRTRVSIPAIRSWAGALGMSYVLEGSTLGLQIVRKRLGREHVAMNAAGRFLLGYGPDTRARWRGFVAALDAAPVSQWPEAIAVAQATFAAFHQRFALPDPVPA